MHATVFIKFGTMVFCIKYRKKILFDKDRVEFFKEICSEIGERYWFKFDAICTDGDHVHIFVGAAPRYAPSRIMQIIKSIMAKNIFKKYPGIKKQLWGGLFWSDGGYISSSFSIIIPLFIIFCRSSISNYFSP